METTTDISLSTINSTSNSSLVPPEFEHSLPLGEFIPVTLAYGLAFVFGVIGNSLVIFSICRNEQMKTITNIFLLSLASADLLLVVCCIPFKLHKFFTFSWGFGEVMCKLIHYIQDVSAICSVTTLTMMSLERYYAIVHPMKAKYVCSVGRARRLTLILWIVSFLLAIPTIYGQTFHVVGIVRKAYWCVRWMEDPTMNKLYAIYSFLLILFLPVCIMTFAYVRICRELWSMTRHRSAMRSATEIANSTSYGPRSNNSTPSKWSTNERIPVLKEVKFSEDDTMKKQVIKMLVAIIVVFVLCWAPVLTDNMLKVFRITPQLSQGIIKYMRQTFFLMSYTNSCVNPIVYGFMSRNFRQAFKRALCGCLKGKQYVRKMTYKNQSYITPDRTVSSNGPRHFESTSTDVIELTDGHNKFCNDEVVRV